MLRSALPAKVKVLYYEYTIIPVESQVKGRQFEITDLFRSKKLPLEGGCTTPNV